MFSKILIANRGEIAVRIIRACKEMGVATVAVYSEADKNALHVALADQSYCIGSSEASESYLNENQIISTAILAGAQAIHPGYGFLSENAHFARLCRKNGLVFIGPDPESMKQLGDKAVLKELIRRTGLRVIPGTKALSSIEETRREAEIIGYPVMLKACAGGGGRGIRLIRTADDLEEAYLQATSEALSAFGDGSVYLEKYIFPARHVELQILADEHGNAVCLGDRDCSLQRRNQKLVEETPSPAVNNEQRNKIMELAVDEQGTEEFQSVCMDVTERHHEKILNEEKRYLKALNDIYDKIFKYDLSNNTVNCLDSYNSPMFKWLENIPMQMEDATEKWITGTVIEEDRERVREFFNAFRRKNLYKSGEAPPQICYKARSSSGKIKTYSGIFLKMNESISFYCCRCVPDSEETEALKSENISLKETVQELVSRFKEGIAAFEVRKDYVTPLYASDNVCEFFGFSKEEWLPLMQNSTLIKDFVSRSKVDYEDFAELLRTGEAEFTYYDLGIKDERRIKAICSPKSPEASPRYVMLYNIGGSTTLPDLETVGSPTVYIRTFGYFDVFVGEKPIPFRNKKSKELLALLVDRRGGYITSEEAIGFLWEDEPVSPVTLARYRKVALRLKNTLEEYGISDVVESVDGKRRIVMENVKCDLYDYLSGNEKDSQLFKGSYLTNYSWGETTLAELTRNMLY